MRRGTVVGGVQGNQDVYIPVWIRLRGTTALGLDAENKTDWLQEGRLISGNVFIEKTRSSLLH